MRSVLKGFEEKVYSYKDRIPLVLCLIAASLLFFSFVYFSSFNMSYPYDLISDEGNLAIATEYVVSGSLGKLYNPLHLEPLFFYNDYPPLIYFITASVYSFSGDLLFSGRLVSVLSTFLCSVLVMLIVRDRTKRLDLSLLSFLLFYSSNVIFYWSSVFRPDMTALMFSLVGIYLVLSYSERDVFIYAAAFSFILAVFTKQTYFIGFVASSIYLYLRERDKVQKFILSFMVPSIFLFLVLNIFTDYQFLMHLVFNNIGISFGLRNFIFEFLIGHSILLIISVYYALRNYSDLIPLYLFLSIFVGLFQSMKTGGWHQYFIPLMVPLSILPPYLLYSLRGKKVHRAVLISSIIAYIGIMIFLNPIVLTQSFDGEVYPNSNMETDRMVDSYVNNHSRILIENRGYLLRNNRTITPEMWGTVETVNTGRLKSEEVYSYYREYNITLIAYHHQDLFTDFDPLQKYIEESCDLQDELEFERRHSVGDYWSVYECGV